ncbi:hypothetical protein M3C58_12910 [Brachybacterium muris]|uniref:hypothetical protein n=1 Tax=Brachybacterium muris TaxID=219301 RepID=UPI00223A8B57|nr:hypothetical protein [Brachybacterium muris]MCT2176253.1 hypothetical protein [Brachybacterium muris]
MSPSTPDPEQQDTLSDSEFTQLDERWMSLIDTALKVQTSLARSYVTRLRAKHPGATREELLEHVSDRFTNLLTITGAGVGGVAALPGIGTAVAVGVTVGEGISFAEACAFLTLAAAEIYDVDMRDRQTRHLVMTAVLGGEHGTEIIAKALGKQGLQWNAVLGGSGMVPNIISKQVTRYVRRRVGARTGGLWLGRLLPFGVGAVIGGVGSRTVARSVVEAVEQIFHQAPTIEGELAGDRPSLEG